MCGVVEPTAPSSTAIDSAATAVEYDSAGDKGQFEFDQGEDVDDADDQGEDEDGEPPLVERVESCPVRGSAVSTDHVFCHAHRGKGVDWIRDAVDDVVDVPGVGIQPIERLIRAEPPFHVDAEPILDDDDEAVDEDVANDAAEHEGGDDRDTLGETEVEDVDLEATGWDAVEELSRVLDVPEHRIAEMYLDASHRVGDDEEEGDGGSGGDE